MPRVKRPVTEPGVEIDQAEIEYTERLDRLACESLRLLEAKLPHIKNAKELAMVMSAVERAQSDRVSRLKRGGPRMSRAGMTPEAAADAAREYLISLPESEFRALMDVVIESRDARPKVSEPVVPPGFEEEHETEAEPSEDPPDDGEPARV